LFALSVLIAILASGVALWIAFRLRGEGQARINRTRIGASLIMGCAIVGMHYTGMAAAISYRACAERSMQSIDSNLANGFGDSDHAGCLRYCLDRINA
jgi:NO-binding membrane sensor protein with MHYT domain